MADFPVSNAGNVLVSQSLGVFSIAVSMLIGIVVALFINMVACYKYLFIDNKKA